MINTPNNADDWEAHWNNISEISLLNPGTRYRTMLVVKLLRRLGMGGSDRLLEIGCGAGNNLVTLDGAFPKTDMAGVDISQSGIDIARRRVPGIKALKWNLLEKKPPPPELAGWANFALCSEVLEHVDNPVEMLLNSLAFMAPGCRLLVTVPGGPMSDFDRYIGHRRHYTPASISAELQAAGLYVEQAMRAGFPFHMLFRLLVLTRGNKLKQDAIGAPTGLVKLVMAIFSFLQVFNLSNAPFGWQIVAIARR